MSMQNYEKAKELIEELGGGDFEGPKPESLVVKAEVVLGVMFPPSYRRFLMELGCGDIGGVEVFGLIDDNFEKSSVPNGIWLTLNERNAMGLDPAFIIVGEGGDGTYCVIDTREVDSDGESPVIRLSVDGEEVESLCDSFGSTAIPQDGLV